MILSNQEKLVFRKGYQIVAGIDEVGRGCLAGPVAAAVVVLKRVCISRTRLKMHKEDKNSAAH